MKINLLISLLFLGAIFSKIEYDLNDGIEKEITNIDRNSKYSFYIKASYPNSARITVKNSNTYYSSSISIYFYEYANRNSSSYHKYDHALVYNRISNNNYAYYCSFSIKSSSTNYVEFNFSPDYNDKYIIVRIDIGKEYDLYNNKSLYIYNLNPNTTHYLYLDLYEAKKVNISFKITNYLAQEPFSNINIHEYETRNFSVSRIISSKEISFSLNNTQLIATFSYELKSSNFIKYLALELKPSIKINNIIVKYEYPIYITLLNNNISRTIDNLISNEIYLFYISATQCSKVNISINNNYTDYNSFENIIIYEYEQKNDSISSYISRNIKNLYKEKDSHLIAKISVKVNSSRTNYLAFSIKPKKDINYRTLVNIDVSGRSYELKNKTSKSISNLKPENDYHFFIKVAPFYFVNFTLTMNNLKEMPFSLISHQELMKRDQYDDKKDIINYSISPIIKENQLIVSMSHVISEVSTEYLNVKITPSYNIDNMNAKFDVTNCLIDLFFSKETVYNIKSNIPYYIDLNGRKDKDIVLHLTVSSKNNNNRAPFHSIKIYRCFVTCRALSKAESESYLDNLEFKNQQYKIKIKSKKSLSPLIEFKPLYDIDYIICEKEYVSSDSKFSTILLIIIISSIILIALIILIIIIRCRKSKLSSSIDLDKSPLYPNNQSELISEN